MSLRFLDRDDVLHVHANQLELYGGSPGMRDVGLLDSALAMPQAGFGGEYFHPTVHEMAAAYLFHIVQNHPFLDGNKRTGAAAALVFLADNGVRIRSDNEALYDLVIGVTAGSVTKSDVATHFRARST